MFYSPFLAWAAGFFGWQISFCSLFGIASCSLFD
jgi:hypothetical protein